MIERLTLGNFKSIKEKDFDLENLSLLSGLNGMGKSSIIQSLLLLRQSYEKHLLPNSGISLTGDYVSIGTGSDLLFSDANDEKICIEVYTDDSELKLPLQYMESSDHLPINKDEFLCSGKPFETSLFSNSFQYLSADRISPKSTYSISDHAVNTRRFLGIKGEYTAHFIAEHGSSKLAIAKLNHPSATSNELAANIDAWMSDITPGTRVNAKVIREINQASLHYQFSTSSEMTKPFRPENTGFGLTYVLPVVTAVLSAKKGDLLIIENPESHLHPAGQTIVAKLFSIAASEGVQIIVETHSDHFLNGVRRSIKNGIISNDDACAYFMSRDKDCKEHSVEIKRVQFRPEGKMNEWPDGFFDEWDKSLNDLIGDI